MKVFSHNLTESQSIIKTLPKVFLHKNYTTENVALKLASLTPLRILSIIAFYSLSLILIISGIAKIIDTVLLLNTLKLVVFLPTELQILIATILPVVEVALAVLMLMKIKLKIIMPIVAALFAIFFGFSIYGTAFEFGSDCGCFGNTVTSSFGSGMILRNTVFFMMSLMININAWPSKLNNQ